MEDWALIRRLHLSERVPKAQIARDLGISRNTVAKALASGSPPRYRRAAKGSAVDAFEPAIRSVLAEFPEMPATVIAERIGWDRSLTVLKDRVRQLRPLFVPPDPCDRVEYVAGQVAQCDLWFPPRPISVGPGRERVLPVLAMTCGYSRVTAAVMIPSRRGGDILAGMWQLIRGVGRVTKTLVWDRESAIGGGGRVTVPAAAFAGTLAAKILLAPPRDAEFKGMVERNNGFLETSFLPGRRFTSPADFNAQLAEWLVKANARTVRSIHGRPVDLLESEYHHMLPLPPIAPAVGLSSRIRLGRDYYVRIDANDYSIDPKAIGRFVDVTASMSTVTAVCDGQPAARHPRCWAKAQVITDPAHVESADFLVLVIHDVELHACCPTSCPFSVSPPAPP